MPELTLCGCGCGESTAIRRGKPNRFIRGHNSRGETHPMWAGGRRIDQQGYVLVRAPEHPRAAANGYVHEHVVVAEQALGKPLPEQAVVHHHSEDRSDNRNGNLVICEDRSYHGIIHRRMRALEACGNANWRQCRFCREWDSPDNLYILPSRKHRGSAHHTECKRRYDAERSSALRKGGVS